MSHQQPLTRGRRGTFGVAAAAVLLVIGLVVLVIGFRGNDGPPQPAAAPRSSQAANQPPAAAAPSTPTSASTTQKTKESRKNTNNAGTKPAPQTTTEFGQFLESSSPTRIQIPSIDLSSTTFVPLSIQKNGTISVPGTEQEVGVYRDGPTPGQLGPSVLAAHVDSPSGEKGIFYRLGAVKAGDEVRISRADKSVLSFTVDQVTTYRKTDFPTDLVYRGDYKKSEIRLVTCGGPTDSANEYRDNVVVFGHLTKAKTAA